ncbi:sodium:solute symporter family transporter [Cardinium endosymbiont of Philonthus spinipes]|uniref:sodium:solute symporter family transporter n=1 Tax=Cardinium endosymbiont of Philonthus spinipes TaxID=3077941 RepID=UPI00313D22B5
MLSLYIPLLMVAAFLLFEWIFVSCLSIIPTTFRDYSVSTKQHDTPLLVYILLFTFFESGLIVRTIQEVHHLGLPWIIFEFLSGCIPFWIVSCLALRMGPFMHNLSMSETIGNVYGRYPMIITSLSNICCATVVVAIQMNIISLAINICLDWVDPRIVTFLTILLLGCYTVIGRMRVFSLTNIGQLVAFLITPLILSCWMSMRMDEPLLELLGRLFMSQAKNHLNNLSHSDFNAPAILSLFLANQVSCIQPLMMQKVYMSSDHFQARSVFFYTGIFGAIMKFFILLFSLILLSAAPTLSLTEIWSYIVTGMPPALKGLVAISLLSAAMSVADTYLNTPAVLFSHDIVEGMMDQKWIPYRYQIRLAKLIALLMGLVAMLLNTHCSDLMELCKLHLDCFIPIAIAPFILAVLGFRGTSRTALMGMAAGILAIWSWNKWVEPITHINGAFPSMVANCLAMMVAHYFFPRPKKELKQTKQSNENHQPKLY